MAKSWKPAADVSQPAEFVELVARAGCALKAKGSGMTALRSEVLWELWHAKQPLGAYTLADRLNLRLSDKIAPNSVYRILEVFQALGLIKRIESRHAYVVSREGSSDGDIFLLCDGCGSVTALSDQRVHGLLSSTSATIGFKPERQVIEVNGRCHSCTSEAGHA